MELGLAGMTVVVTGASGGIGRAVALAFEAEGAQVAWLVNSGKAGREGAFEVRADLRDPSAVEEAFDTVRKRFGRIDICIANAGWRAEPAAPLAQADPERVRRTIETNVLGSMWTARAFLSRLTPREDGRGASLLFVGSTAGRFGERGWSEYATSKAALTGLVSSLKNEIVAVDSRGRVNLVEPGWTKTHMARAGLEDKEAITRAVRTMALRQIAKADDIARTILWLSSPLASRHITGQTVTIAGGMEGRLLWERAQIDAERIRGSE